MCRKTKISYFRPFLLGILGILVASIILLSCVPPVSKDALVHHLAVPKLYLRHGGIHEIPFMVFSYYPMNLDLLYLVPLYFGNDIIPKFIHFTFALLTAWLIFSYLMRRIDSTYALFGVIFYLSMPIIVKLSITVYVDLGLVFFSTASLLLVLRWAEEGFGLRLLLLSALFCGLAAGTKYNGLITLFLLSLFVPFLYSRYTRGRMHGFLKPARYGILFLFVALLCFSPWMIRNYVWTSNPVFPLYDQWFNPQDELNRQAVDLFTVRSSIYHESWWQVLLLPVRVFFQGQDGNPQYFDGKLNPFLLLLPFCAYYRMEEDPQVLRTEKVVLHAFVLLFFASAFFGGHMRIRYISPIIPPLVILSTFGVRNMVKTVAGLSGRYLRDMGFAAIFLITSFSLWLNVCYIRDQYEYVDPLGYLSGNVSRDEYIGKFRSEYPAMRYINENLPADARVLFMFLGNRGYYCDRQYVLDMQRNRSTFRQLVKASSDPQTIFLGLKDMGITHILIHYDIFDEWCRTNFSMEEREVIRAFFKKYMRLLFFKRGYGVSLIVEPPRQASLEQCI